MGKEKEKNIRILGEEYLVSVHCTNCNRDFTAAIRKGYTVEESLSVSPACPNCNCKTLVIKK